MEQLTDVWTLEIPNEEIASEDLNSLSCIVVGNYYTPGSGCLEVEHVYRGPIGHRYGASHPASGGERYVYPFDRGDSYRDCFQDWDKRTLAVERAFGAETEHVQSGPFKLTKSSRAILAAYEVGLLDW